MKFFTVSLFVLLSSAILEGSFATPAHKNRLLGNLGGLVGNVANTVDTLVDNVVEILHNTVAELFDLLNFVLDEDVVSSFNELLVNGKKALECTVGGILDDVITFVPKLIDNVIVTINKVTHEVCVNGEVFGTLRNDCSIVDLEGNLIGYCDPEKGLVLLLEDVVDELVYTVNELVENVGGVLNVVLQAVDQLLGGVTDLVKEALDKISDDISFALAKLNSATENVARKVVDLINKTGKAVVCVAEDLDKKILTFKDVCGNSLVTVDLQTNTVQVGDLITIGILNEDGSIVDSLGNIFGCFDNRGVITVAGETVDEVVNTDDNLTGGLNNLG